MKALKNNDGINTHLTVLNNVEVNKKEKEELKSSKFNKRVDKKTSIKTGKDKSIVSSDNDGKVVIDLFSKISEIDTSKESLRISEELLRNDKIKEEMFFSEIFKKNFVKYDKSAKCFICSIERHVIKDLLRSTNLIKSNSMYSISSIRDMYILQLLTLENEIVKFYAEKQNLIEGTTNLKDKIIAEKEEDIKRLENKLQIKYIKSEKAENIEMIDNSLKKIDEFMSSSIQKFPVSKKKKAYQSVIEEMNKYKLIILEIIESSKRNKQEELQLFLEKISNELPDLANEIKNDVKNGFLTENSINCSAYNSIGHLQNDLVINEEVKVNSFPNKEVSNSFNFMSYLTNLKKSLENTLVYYDKYLFQEFKKIEIVTKKKEIKNPSSKEFSFEDTSHHLTESLSNIRRTSLLKRKHLNQEIECRSQSVGKLWSESLKYSRVENSKTLREIRIGAELRDVLLMSFQNIINNIVSEMQNPKSKFISSNEKIYSTRKIFDLELCSINLSLNRGRNESLSSIDGIYRAGFKRKSVDSLLYKSVNKFYNSTFSVNEKKKPKNLNDYILKKN